MGERLKEASCINLSLTTLNHVIMCICRGQRAPPFRDSALTRLLQVRLLSRPVLRHLRFNRSVFLLANGLLHNKQGRARARMLRRNA